MKRLPRVYLYILLGEDGRTYIGITSRLRRRLRQHNSPSNRGYTRGQRWHLLGVRMYLDRASAALMEKRLKRWYRGRGNYQLDAWIRQQRPRLRTLCERYGISHRLC